MKRITGDKHRKGLGTSRVDDCRSGRRFCFSEFNSTGWQKDRSKEYFCSARIFYFVVFRPQSLLDVLES